MSNSGSEQGVSYEADDSQGQGKKQISKVDLSHMNADSAAELGKAVEKDHHVDAKDEMTRTFQTNEQREEYQTMLENLQEKYTHIESKASDALNQKWNTKKEILHMAKPKKMM